MFKDSHGAGFIFKKAFLIRTDHFNDENVHIEFECYHKM